MPQERNPRRFAEEVDQRKQARSGGYADGSIIPVDIRSGLMDAVVRPIADDWAQGNKAIRSIRNRYPTIDAAVGLHPVVAASQLANDVMSDDIGVDSAMNVLQAVPIVKRLSGLGKLLSKQSGPVVGGTKFVVDVPATVRKNVVLTGAQATGQPGEAFARGGIIPVRGKGTGTSDSIPAVLAGHEVRVSNGEGVAVLPAKTMRTPGALDAVEGIIAATNKRPPQPRTGGAGAYQTGVAGLVDDTAGRIVQAPAVTAPADGILAGIRDFASPTLPNMGPNLAAAAAPPGTGQSQGFIGGADYSGGPDKQTGFVWPDGTPRVQPGQQGAVAPAAQAPGLLTMKERDIAAGLDPNRAYRPGTAGDPYAAAGGIAAAAQGRSAVPVADTAGVLPQMLDAVPGRRRRRGRRAGGGILDWLPEGGYLKDAEAAQGAVNAVKNAPAIGAPLTIYGGPKPITEQQLYGSAPPVNDPQQRLIEGQGLRPDAGLTGPRAGSQSFKMLRQPETEALPVVAAPKPAQQPIAATYSNEGRPSAIQAANAVPASDRTGIDTLPSGIVSANMGRGFDPTKLQMADGYGAATNASGKTLFVSPGQYRAADGSTTADWRQTQEYKDAIDRNAADKLRLAEMQAQRQGRDPVATLAASRGIADAVLNAPIERQAKQAQAQTAQQQAATGKIAVQQAQELNDLYAAHQAATTPAEQGRIAEMIRVRTGKDKPDEYAHASGGTTVNPTTMAVEKTPDVIYNRRTGQTQVAGQPSASQPKQAPQSAIDALRANPALAAQFQQKYGYLPQKP
jgi:hypothetical protein